MVHFSPQTFCWCCYGWNMYAHAHIHENMTRGSFAYIVHQIFFSLISLAKFLCHSLNLNSAASAECSKWKEEAEARIADVCSQLPLPLRWLFSSSFLSIWLVGFWCIPQWWSQSLHCNFNSASFLLGYSICYYLILGGLINIYFMHYYARAI